MSFLETLRGAPTTASKIPFGVMLRRISDHHENPPLAELQHFLTDNRDRFVRVPVVDGKPRAQYIGPLSADNAGFLSILEGEDHLYYIWPEIFSVEATPDRWTAGEARQSLAQVGYIHRQGARTSCKGFSTILRPYGLEQRRMLIADSSKVFGD